MFRKLCVVDPGPYQRFVGGEGLVVSVCAGEANTLYVQPDGAYRAGRQSVCFPLAFPSYPDWCGVMDATTVLVRAHVLGVHRRK